jgi:hypothetical protein
MINWPMLYDFGSLWLFEPLGIYNVCIGYCWPVSTPEVFICFPSLGSWVIATVGVQVWYILLNEMLGRPLKFLHRRGD